MKQKNKIKYTAICIAFGILCGYAAVSAFKGPKISVVMSTYNRGEGQDSLLARAIDSILAQTEKDFEFIIINDGSTDNTHAILKKYAAADPRIIILTNETNKGLPYSLNRGLERARGKYIARMDDDDKSYPTRFEKQVSFLDTHSHIDATGCSFTFNENHPEQAYSFPQNPDESKIRTFRAVPVVHPCAMIRRAFIEKHNIRYPETYPNAEDMPFWFDFTLKYNGLISNLPDVLLLKKGNAKKKKNYNEIQNESVARYQKDTFAYFLKRPDACTGECDCYSKLAASGAVDHIISPEALQNKIKQICPPDGAVSVLHPLWNDYFIFDSPKRLHRFFGYDTATVLEHDKNLLKIKWDKWGIETFIRQDNGKYIFSDEKE